MIKSRAGLSGWGAGKRSDGPTPPRRRKSKIRALLLFGLLIIAGIAVQPLSNALFSPWAWSLTGRPTLPGYWHGEMPFGRDAQRRVAMNLRAVECRRCSNDVEGEATVCAAGRPIHYEFSGEVADHNANHFTLSLFTYPDAGAPGTHLSSLDGTWAGGDEIRLTGKLEVTNADGSWSSNKQPTEPTRFRLNRGTEADFTSAS
ncbi:hypothetical protein ACIBQX_04140 [Nonomuraea sp. NPDC049714]|uniref:hypothetical protein n=1 Tax=Nonomuraea sp. NPDC049714 TaxID=3364357 RepID=UPI003790799E